MYPTDAHFKNLPVFNPMTHHQHVKVCPSIFIIENPHQDAQIFVIFFDIFVEVDGRGSDISFHGLMSWIC